MRFNVEYPLVTHGYDPRFLEPEQMNRFLRVLEDIDADGVSFTEHPAPSAKWLAAGGHESFDPLTALAYCAAASTRLKLMTFLLVLPLHNPMLVAKQIATLDVVSGGRLILTAGTGYLRSEFAALGVNFDERNALFDEAVEVLRGLWSGEPLEFRGHHFTVVDQLCLPAPVQRPHPPLWIGGNSRATRSRVARYADGWAPLMTRPEVSQTTRTPHIDDLPTLRAQIQSVQAEAEALGRDPSTIHVQLKWGSHVNAERDPQESLDLLEELDAIGVDWVVISPPGKDLARCIDVLEAFGKNVIEPNRKGR